MSVPLLRIVSLCGLGLASAWGATEAVSDPQDAPTVIGSPDAPAPWMPDASPAAPPQMVDGRAAPPFLPPGSVDAPGPGVAPLPDARQRAEVVRLRGTVDRGGAGAGEAAWRLGLAALHGIGGPVQPHEAQQWFARALRLGELQAAAGMAWCAIDGCGSPPDPASARRWITALRRVDPARATFFEWLLQSRLAPVQLSARPALQGAPPQVGEGRDATPARQLGREQLEASARGGNVHAAIELGIEMFAAGRDREALERFQAAAPRSPAATHNASIVAQRLASRTRDPAATPAADLFARAQRYHRGDRVPANFTEAIRLYRLAQSRGSVPARRMLELIASRPAPDGSIDVGWMQQLAQVDVTTELPTFSPAGSQRLLRRERTPLADLLPPPWRAPADEQVR